MSAFTPTSGTVNLDLLNRALDTIESDLSKWDQNQWVNTSLLTKAEVDTPPLNMCGTTMCLAGHILLLTGRYVIAWKKYYEYDAETNPNAKEAAFFDTAEGEWVENTPLAASKALNIAYDDYDGKSLGFKLFYRTGYRGTANIERSEREFLQFKERTVDDVMDYLVAQVTHLQGENDAFHERVKELEAQVPDAGFSETPTGVDVDPRTNLEHKFGGMAYSDEDLANFKGHLEAQGIHKWWEGPDSLMGASCGTADELKHEACAPCRKFVDWLKNLNEPPF